MSTTKNIPTTTGVAKASILTAGLEPHKFQQLTTAPIQPAEAATVSPEFGRWRDVQRMFGIKRGTLYSLLLDGKVRGVLLRIRGSKSGVRLFDLQSIREYIAHCQDEQEAL